MGKQHGFYFDSDRCVQCHACEVACKSWHGVAPGIGWRKVRDLWEGQFPAVSNKTVSFSCMHCEKPACVAVCTGKAISKRAEDGIVVVDESKCTRCRACEAACPFHIPQSGPTGLMQKCDLCLERLHRSQQPVCIATCPGEALKCGAIEDLLQFSKGAERLAGRTDPSFVVSGRLKASEVLSLL